MSRFLLLWKSAAAIGISLLAGTLLAAEARKPNILIIVGDDMGYADIGVHGCKDIPTPHIDSIAKNGIRCTSGYVSGPYCSPTRAGLMTGRYQQRFGHEFNPGPNPVQAFGLPLTEVTLADKLKAGGYATGMVGKWHLGNDPKHNPVNRGFEEFFGFLGGGHQYFPPRPGGKGSNNAILRGLERVVEREYLTDAFAREAVAYIDKHQKEPFFLYLTFNAVHNPLQASDKYLARFPDVKDENRQKYCGMMSAMDDAIGNVLKKLDDCKITEETLIFFVSDNGGPPVNASSNGTLHGNKAQTWEGGIRVPYLMQWKGKLPAGKTFDQPVIQLDIHPTALAAAGLVRAVKEQAGPPLDGVNLLPHLAGEVTTPPHDALYWRFGEQTAIRSGDHKLVKARGGSGGWELYDLAADIGETKNLAADKPDLAKNLLAKYDAWNSLNIKPLWGAPAGGGKGKAGLKKLLEKEE